VSLKVRLQAAVHGIWIPAQLGPQIGPRVAGYDPGQSNPTAPFLALHRQK